MVAVRNAIDRALAERDSNLDKFCTYLDKDITILNKKVKSIKQEAQVGWNNQYQDQHPKTTSSKLFT